MTSTLCLNEACSTTRLLTKEKPKIINKLEEKFETLLFLPEGEGRRGEGGLRTKGFFKKMYEDKPLISIITVVYNGEKYLEETIQSVINQTYDNVEYIIIDGGSTDGTLDIIKKYEQSIDYWVSERDSGIYDAMNKGISLFAGEYIWFMNSGDTIHNDDVLNKIFKNFSTKDIYYGDTQLILPNKIFGKLVKAPQEINQKSFSNGMVVSHQALIVHQKLVGLYNLKYKYVADHDWIIRALQQTSKTEYVRFPIANYLLDGFSQNNFGGCWKDRFLIINDHYGKVFLFLNYLLYLNALIKNKIKGIFGI